MTLPLWFPPREIMPPGPKITPLPTIDGGWPCILADCPWSFLSYRKQKRTPHRTAMDHYPVMTLEELSQIPVKDIAAKNSALFMWVIGSHLDAAFDLGRSWGFEFKTDAFVWLKLPQGGNQWDIFEGEPEARMSMGYWTRKQTEQLWLFTRGKPRRLSKGVRQVIRAPRQEHSRKPEEQYAAIESLVAGPRLELFARRPREGWTVWGNETEKFAK